jgi:uncharacterized protein
MTTSDFHAAVYEGGGFRLEDYVNWISGLDTKEQTSVLVRNLKERLFGDPRKGLYSGLPLRTLDQKVTGKQIAYWRRWVDHDDPADPFWKPIQNIHNMADVQAPVSMVGGWSDLFLPFQVRDFKAHERAWQVGPPETGAMDPLEFPGCRRRHSRCIGLV